MRLVLISIGAVIAGIFALYCAAGFFDVIWQALGDWIVGGLILAAMAWHLRRVGAL